MNPINPVRSGVTFISRILSVLLSLSALWLLAACSDSDNKPGTVEVASEARLAEHTKEFRKEVIKVTDGVWVAVGFGLANSIMVEGNDGVVIIDTMETIEEGLAVRKEFEKITTKPIKAVIYTHNHTDHVFGAGAFVDGNNPVDVYAHETTQYYIDRVVNVIRPIITVRSARMFGTHLTGTALENAGIGPHLGITEDSHLRVVRPNKTFKDHMAMTVAGVEFELFHAPGETNDQLFVWLPKKKVIMPGDNFYKTFPNLYTIRGTLYRDVNIWAESLDKMRRLKPEFLVPSHSRPLSGQDTIYQILTDYRDAIQFVHDQTIFWMNRGLTPDEIVEKVNLPEHLLKSPYLQEFYGTVDWSVRSVFTGYLGWFDGNPTTLNPLTPMDEAVNMIDLAGGYDAMLEKAKAAAGDEKHQWVLELTDALMRVDGSDQAAIDLRVEALTRLGEAASNPNARHYYLTQALELRDKFLAGVSPKRDLDLVHSIPLRNIFKSMAVSLDATQAGDMVKTVVFNFTDTGEVFSLRLRKGVLEVEEAGSPDAEITVSIEANTWKEIVSRLRRPVIAFASGEIDIEGSTSELIAFLDLFKAPDLD